MHRRDASRAILILMVLVLTFGLFAGLAAAQNNDKRKNRDNDQPEPTPTVAADSGLVDADSDYLPDYMDNCPTVQNPDQADGDGDGIGDVCDEYPNGDPPPAPAPEPEPEPAPEEDQGSEIEVTGPAEAEEIRYVDWNPGVIEVDPIVQDETVAAAGAGETGADQTGTGETGAGQSETVAFTPSEGDAPLPPPAAVRTFEPPMLEPAEPEPDREELPPATFEVIARIDAGVLPPERERRGDSAAPGSVADNGQVATFMQRQDSSAPTLLDQGLLDPERDLLPEPTAPARDLAPILEETVDQPPVVDWEYDDYFAGGLARDRQAVTQIDGTDEPELYFSQRRGDARGQPGDFSYAIPVPEPGTYRVRLHFAEIYWGAEGGAPGGRGKRVFSVDAEDETVLADYDIYDDVGPMTAVVKQFTVDVEDDVLDLFFYGTHDQPMVAAIEVLGDPTGERWVDVDKTTQSVSLMIGSTPVARYRASFGMAGQDTPVGTYAIQNKIAELTWTPYAQNYFMYWAAYDQANELGFHSWVMDETGRVVQNGDGPTFGCIATHPDDAAAIYSFVEVGTRIVIHT